MIRALAALAIALSTLPTLAADHSYDVVVYGGTSGGVAAAVQASRLGKSVALVEPSNHLGGMTASGLGWTDIGRPEIVGAIAREFFRRVYTHYQRDSAWTIDSRAKFLSSPAQGASKAIDEKNQVMWLFEPHVAEQLFNDLAKEANVAIFLSAPLDLSKSGVTKDGPRIISFRTETGDSFSAKIFIDASYEGDLMAKAGVPYVTGRESNAAYDETINGIQTHNATKNQLPDKISPYLVPTDPNSGLLPLVNPTAGGPDGSADQRIQAYCYRMVLTDSPQNRIEIDKPADYDEKRYEILFRAIEAGQSDNFFKLNLVPNRKTDSNNAGGISTDLIGANYDYPDADHATRKRIAAAHETWQRGLVWTLQHHPRVPQNVRDKYAPWALPRDEFADTNHWPHQLYVREARRMIGLTVISQNSVTNDAATRPVALGGYSMDSHNVQRHVTPDGQLKDEGDVQIRVPKPYRIDYSCLVPKPEHCTNLLVPFCVSATHAAFSTIRMEPVFMELGQSAATAAAIAIDQGTSVQDVPYDALRARLLQDHAILEWVPPKR